MRAGTIPSYIVDILSPFVGPSVCLFIEKLTPIGSNFDEHSEEAKTHLMVENLDDASEYVHIRDMTKERGFALPRPI